MNLIARREIELRTEQAAIAVRKSTTLRQRPERSVTKGGFEGVGMLHLTRPVPYFRRKVRDYCLRAG